MTTASSTSRARRARVWSHDPRRRSRLGLGVGFASMIDVVFLLLMYFLLTMDFREPEFAVGVLAPAEGTRADPFAFPTEPVRISVTPSGAAASIDGAEIAQARTTAQLAAALRVQVGVTILGDEDVEIHATDGVPWEPVYALLDALTADGFASVRLVEHPAEGGGR